MQNHCVKVAEKNYKNTSELNVGVKSRLDLSGNTSEDKGTESDIVTAHILIMSLKCS